MTREHRMKVAEAQEEKARYHMYGGKERYDEAVKWEKEKKEIAKAMLEREAKRKYIIECLLHE